MGNRRPNQDGARWRRPLAVCLLLLAPGVARPQDSQPADGGSLQQRERTVQQRLETLQGRMLELSRLLAESKPEKAERLRDTLDQAGRRQVDAKLQRLTELLGGQKLSEADLAQTELLGDLSALLTLLESPLNELDRLREQRKRLEELKRQVSDLMGQQRRVLYQTERAAESKQRIEGEREPQPPGAAAEDTAGEEVAQRIRRLQELQHNLQRRAAELRGQFKGDSGEPAPGKDSMEQAHGAMQEAADELGEEHPDSAQPPQQEAINQMQQTVDKLEQNLRQLRQEEREETLAALETRLRGLVEKERRVRESIEPLLAVAAADWTRLEHLQLTEASELHDQALEQARLTLRLLIDEGTTIVVPELMKQVVGDMDLVSQQFGQTRADKNTAALVDGVIAQLDEILGAVEQQRDDDSQANQPGQQGGSDDTKALLSRSAELKLLRGAQMRINHATAALDATGGDASTAEYWARRQQQLLEQARRMAENE